MLVLQYEAPNGQWYQTSVGEARPQVVVGRAQGCDVVLPDVRSLSRRNCAFLFREGYVVLVDLQSSAGTFVNNERVETAVVYPGDIVSAGALIIFLRDPTEG